MFDPRLSPVLDSFRFNTGLFKMFTKDLDPKDWGFGGKNANSIAWIVGHLALYRRNVLRKLGDDIAVADWESMVARGAKKGENDLVPFATEIVESIFYFSDKLPTLLENIAPEKLEESIGRKLPNGLDTVYGMISFVATHETYHLGQVSLLRIELSKTAV